MVGFEFEARRATIGGVQISEGRRLVVFEFEARRATIGGIRISEGLRLVVFEFHCSYLESREVPEKTRGKPGEKKVQEIQGKSAENYLPFISGSGDLTYCHFR